MTKVYEWQCPKCSKIIRSLYEKQFEQHKKEHTKTHNKKEGDYSPPSSEAIIKGPSNTPPTSKRAYKNTLHHEPPMEKSHVDYNKLLKGDKK